MEPRQGDLAQRASCSKRIKPNLQANIGSQKQSGRSKTFSARSAYPIRQEASCIVHQAQTSKQKLHCINMRIKHFYSLQKLNLDLQGKESIEMDMYYIAQALKKSTSLQSLTLNCGECYKITNKALCYLGRGLKRLSLSLKSLDLSFRFRSYNEQITDERLNYLNYCIKKLTHLEALSLNFDFCPKISNSGAAKLIANLENHHLLKSLAFSFSAGDDFIEKGFLDLCDALKKLPSLETLSLRLRSSKRVITDSVLKRLGEVLERHASLRSLNLNVEIHEETSDLGLHDVFKGLEKLASLKNLSFYVVGGWSSRRLGDGGLLDLSEALKNLAHLRTLKIDFLCRDVKFSNQGLSHLSEGFEQLKSLEEISLRCGEALKITDQGLKTLGQGLKKLDFLRSIKLNLDSLEKITDLAGEKFCEELKNLPNLKEFDLQVERSFKFTGAGLYKTCQALKDIPSLQIIRFNLGEKCGYIKRDRLLQALENPVAFFPNLPENFDPKSNNACAIF